MSLSDRLNDLAHLLALLGRDLQGWSLFDELLVPALNGALALAQRHHVAVLISQHLELDVPRPLDELLHVKRAVAEGVRGLRRCLLEERGKLLLVAADAHTASAAARNGLEDDRILHGLRPVERCLLALDHAVGTGQNRHLGLLHRLPCRGLLAHHARHFRRRPDELDVARAADLGEVGVLAQQPVTRMNGVRARNLGGRDHRRNVEIAVLRRRRSNADRLVGKLHMEAVAIRLRVHSNRANAHLLARADHAQGNLSTVGNQYLTKHA
jgi:hypothetical protein